MTVTYNIDFVVILALYYYELPYVKSEKSLDKNIKIEFLNLEISREFLEISGIRRQQDRGVFREKLRGQ